MVGECNVWFVTADGGESWTSTNLTGVGASNYNGTGINYLAMDRFANMIAVVLMVECWLSGVSKR